MLKIMKHTYIKVFWYSNNFGDEICPYLIRKISGKTPICCKPTIKGAIHDLVDSVYKRKSIKEALLRLRFIFMNDPILLGVGSILTLSNKRTIAWGAGFMSNTIIINSGSFRAVRGQETAKRLKELGLLPPKILGDPALLLPLYYNPLIKKKYRIGIIPHISEYTYFNERWSDVYKIINLRTKDVESVIDQIKECEYILSSSLHGIIVSHSYNIPCLWIENKVLEKDGFKYKDYFSSVGITPYRGFNNIEYILASEENIRNLFLDNTDKSHINISLTDIQKNLLSVCPFNNNEFKSC